MDSQALTASNQRVKPERTLSQVVYEARMIVLASEVVLLGERSDDVGWYDSSYRDYLVHEARLQHMIQRLVGSLWVQGLHEYIQVLAWAEMGFRFEADRVLVNKEDYVEPFFVRRIRETPVRG